MTVQLWILAVGAAIAGLVQGISGFAFSMVAVSIWVWGVDPKFAAVMAVFGGVRPDHLRDPGPSRMAPSILWPFVVGSAIGIPIGTQLLPMLDPNRFKLVFGLVAGGVLLDDVGHLAVAESRDGGRVADAGVGLLGGVMAPLSGFSGLAPALWCTLRGYNKDEHRAVIQNFNLIVLSATVGVATCGPDACAATCGRRWRSSPASLVCRRCGDRRSTLA